MKRMAGGLLYLAVLAGLALGCTRKPSDYEQARAELDVLMEKTIQTHTEGSNRILGTDNPEEMLFIIQVVTQVKQSINSGIDSIAARYPDLNEKEIRQITEFMQKRIADLDQASLGFERAVDSVIHRYSQDQARATPLIKALKDYQMLGQSETP